MKHYLSFIVLLIVPWLSLAQDYRVITSFGNVEIDSRPNNRHKVKANELLSGKDILYVENNGMLTLNLVGTEKCISIGPTVGKSIESILDDLHFSFWKKVVSAIKGVDNDRRLNAAIKGEDPVPSFLYAFYHPSFSPSLNVRFEIIREGDENGPILKDGERVHFRLINDEEVPLFVSLIWIDTVGDPVDCLEQVTPFLLMPPHSNIELTDAWMEICPPYGDERICLFCSEEAFNTIQLINDLKNGVVGELGDIAIGFDSQIVHTSL